MNGEVQAIDWGAEIPVNGKRPEFVKDHDVCCIRQRSRPIEWVGDNRVMTAREWVWEPVVSIRLLADHPHYAPPPQTPDVPPEVVTLTGEQANMLRKVLRLAVARQGNLADEAAACLALMEPVDPDLVEARKAVAEMRIFNTMAGRIMAGGWDDQPIVVATLAAIRGRPLAAGEG